MPSFDHMLAQRRDWVRARAAEDDQTPRETNRTLPREPDPLARFAVLVLDYPPRRGDDDLDDALARAPEPFRVRAAELDTLTEDADGPQPPGVGPSRCWRCGQTVGWTSEDVPAVQSWRPVALVQGPTGAPGSTEAAEDTGGTVPVNLQCLDCAPDVSRQAWPEGEPGGWGAVLPPSCTDAVDGRSTAHVMAVGGVSCGCGAVQRFVPTVAGE